MRLIQFKKDCKLVFYTISEHRRHADLARRFLAVAIVFDDVLSLGAQGDGDVHRALENAVYQLVVQRRNLAPRGIAVAAALGDITLHVQQTAFSRPRVRQRIDDQIFHAGLFRQIDGFQVSRRAVRRFQIDGQVFAHDHAGDLLPNVQRTGFVLGIDETDFLPDSRVVQFRVRSANLSVPQQQRTERLSAAGRTCDADFELGLRALCFSDLNCHVYFLQS